MSTVVTRQLLSLAKHYLTSWLHYGKMYDQNLNFEETDTEPSRKKKMMDFDYDED